jgi:hypothetical protein
VIQERLVPRVSAEPLGPQVRLERREILVPRERQEILGLLATWGLLERLVRLVQLER